MPIIILYIMITTLDRGKYSLLIKCKNDNYKQISVLLSVVHLGTIDLF